MAYRALWKRNGNTINYVYPKTNAGRLANSQIGKIEIYGSTYRAYKLGFMNTWYHIGDYDSETKAKAALKKATD